MGPLCLCQQRPPRSASRRWVHTGHAPDYSVLTLRSWSSVIVIAGGTIFVGATFFAEQSLLRRRDRWAAPADNSYFRLTGSLGESV